MRFHRLLLALAPGLAFVALVGLQGFQHFQLLPGTQQHAQLTEQRASGLAGAARGREGAKCSGAAGAALGDLGAGGAAAHSTAAFCAQSAQLSVGKADDRAVFAIWGPQTEWGTYVSDEYYEILNVELPKLGWVTYEEGMRVDMLLFVEAHGELLANHDRLMKSGNVGSIAFLQDDMHWFERETREMKRRVYNLPIILMMSYAYTARWLYPDVNDLEARALWVPHSAASCFVRPLNRTASFGQVLLTGATSKMWYPYRAVAQIMSKANGIRQVFQIEHPGYNAKSSPESKGAFVDKMAAFGAGITDCLTLQYVVAKVFEIPATGQLLLVNAEIAPLLRNLCMVEGEHFISYGAANMAERIGSVLSTAKRSEVDLIRNQSHWLVQRAHTTTARAVQMDCMARCVNSVRAGASVSKEAIRQAVEQCGMWKFRSIQVEGFLDKATVNRLESSSPEFARLQKASRLRSGYENIPVKFDALLYELNRTGDES